MLKQNLYEAILRGDVMKFYKSKEWLEVRDKIRARDNYECQACKKEGRVGPCDVVHHKKHLRTNPLLALRPSNLVCLCHMHHEREHPEKFEKANKAAGRKKRAQPKGWEERW